MNNIEEALLINGLKHVTEVLEKPLLGCEHYGKSNYGMDSHGNQCELLSGFKPCLMERVELDPCWGECSLNPACQRREAKK